MSSSEAEWWPDPDEIAAILRARTKPADGQTYLGSFTDNTRPTRDEVEALIAQVGQMINGVFAAAEIPESSWEAAKQAAVLRTAQFIEISFTPERTDDSDTVPSLRLLADAALNTLIAGANVRDFFAEATSEA